MKNINQVILGWTGRAMRMVGPIGLLLVLDSTACQSREPLDLLRFCIAQATDELDGKETFETHCDLGRDVRLLALPEGVDADQLVRLGVPREISGGFIPMLQTLGPHWCIVEEFLVPRPANWPKDRPLATDYRYDGSCVVSRIRVQRPTVVRAREVNISLGRVGSSGSELRGLRSLR